MRYTLLIVLFHSFLLFGAKDNFFENKLPLPGGDGASVDYPRNNSFTAPNFVKKDRFEMSVDKDKIDLVKFKEKRFRELLDGTYDLSILQNPVFKVLKTVDTLYLHPNYTTLLILPKGYEITYGHSSFETRLFKISNNIISVQPMRKFQDGNMIFYLTNKTNNFVISINVREYFKNLKCINTYGNYKCADEYFSTIYQYYDEPKLSLDDRLEILKKAKIKYGDYILRSKINVNIEFNGAIYQIIKSQDSNIFYKGQKVQVIPRQK